MRVLLGGLLVLMLASSAALAQVTGQVLQVGFNNRYRPDCWTPMLVQLANTGSDSANYQIQVVQEDLDKDRVVYTTTVSLGGSSEGRQTVENFWVYFRPQPTSGGLPDGSDSTTNINDLTRALRVFLCDANGKQLAQLPMTATIFNVDPRHGFGDGSRSRRLVIFVSDGTDKPRLSENGRLAGVMEDIEEVVVQPKDLPDNVLGYDAVDAVVWLDADANYLTQGTRSPTLDALVSYVHRGGRLVICQAPEAFKDKPFNDLLPVMTRDDGMVPVFDRKDVDALKRIARSGGGDVFWPQELGTTFKVGKTVPAPGAKVDEWMEWPNGTAATEAVAATTAPAPSAVRTPYLARRGVGLGLVTWVAQDLGAAALTKNTQGGWLTVWSRVFDYADQPRENYKPSEDLGQIDLYPAGGGVDLGSSLLNGMELSNRAVYLVSIAALFFVVYWLVAGPGVYFLLAAKNRAHLSWFMFGASALVASALTVLLVKVVVRGPPELKHISQVQWADGEPDGVVRSRFGLYIPQDGEKQIALQDPAPHQVSWLAPFAVHPQYVSSDDTFPAYLQYALPVRTAADTGPVAVGIPYRSTLKKLQAEWVGDVKNRIDIKPGDAGPKLIPAGDGGYIAGSLVNNTGHDLSNVYLAFKHPGTGYDPADLSVVETDWVVYVPDWKSGDPLDLKQLFKRENHLQQEANGKDNARRLPGGDKVCYGHVGGADDGFQFERVWYNTDVREAHEGAGKEYNRAMPLLAFFDRLAPMKSSREDRARAELFRRGGRHVDLSQALSAGNLVVIGQATSSIPLPVTVSDNPVLGDGVTLYESVLPLDRSIVEPAPQPPKAER